MVGQPTNVLHKSCLNFLAAVGFDISEHGILLVAKESGTNQGSSFQLNVYYLSTSASFDAGASSPQILAIRGLEGASFVPTFSPSGKQALFLQKQKGLYEDDESRVVFVSGFDGTTVTELFESEDGNGAWTLSPGSITWSSDGKEFFVSAEDHGR
ncbi:hypothetical protein MMC13_006691 [Lambiella insularis]|nr:hypothetical protein [Lambiella insularis]